MQIHLLVCWLGFLLLVSAEEKVDNEPQKRSPAGETAQASYGVSPGQYVIRTAGPGEEPPQLAPGQYLELLQQLLTQQQGAPPSQAQQHIIRQLLVARDQDAPAIQYQPQQQIPVNTQTQTRAQIEAASLVQQQANVQTRPDRRPMPNSALLQRALQQTYYNDRLVRPRPPARFPPAANYQQIIPQENSAAGAIQYIIPQSQVAAVEQPTPGVLSSQQPLQEQHAQHVERIRAQQRAAAEEAQRAAAVKEAQRAAAEEARIAAAAEEARIAAQQHAAAQRAAQREAAQREAAQRAAAQREAAQREAAQLEAAQRAASQREAAQRAAAQREAAKQKAAKERAAAAQREAAAQRQREELQAQKARELQAQQLLATYEDDQPEDVQVDYPDEPSPVVYQRPILVPSTTLPPPSRVPLRTRRPTTTPSPVVEQYLRETTKTEAQLAPKARGPIPQQRPVSRPIYVPANEAGVSEISQDENEDILASLLPGANPAPARSSIFVTNKIGKSSRGGVTIEEVPLDDGAQVAQVKAKPVPIVRIPTPEGQRPLTQAELQALIDAGFTVTPVEEAVAIPRRQLVPKSIPRSRPQGHPQNVRSQSVSAQQVNQVTYEEPVLGPIIVPEIPKRRIRPTIPRQPPIQVEIPEELRPIPSPRPGFIVRYEDEDSENSASTPAPKSRAEYGSKTRRQRTRRPVRPKVDQQDER